MKQHISFFLFVLFSFSLFAQVSTTSDNTIELPSITTIINAQTIPILPESIPDFVRVAEPPSEKVLEIIEEPVIIVEESQPVIEEIAEENEEKKYALTFVLRTSHPGTITTHTRFESLHSLIPFYAGLKQDSLFGKNARTVLSPYGGAHYDWKYISLGLDALYDGQITGSFEKYVNRGQIDFPLSAHFLEWQIRGNAGFAFTDSGVLYPFDLSVFYNKNNFIFMAAGGLESRYSNLISLVRNNPEKKTKTDFNLGSEYGEESFWYFRTMLDYRYTESLRVGLYAEYMNTYSGNGFYVFDYLGTRSVQRKSMWLINTGINFVYSIQRFDFSLKPLVYWRSAPWCYNFVDIDINCRFEINEDWTLYWSIDDLKEIFTASGGGFSLGARYKF